MSKPTPEQLAEFAKFQEGHVNDPVLTPKVIKGVVNDDIKEADELLENRTKYNRVYNAKSIPSINKKEIKEEDNP